MKPTDEMTMTQRAQAALEKFKKEAQRERGDRKEQLLAIARELETPAFESPELVLLLLPLLKHIETGAKNYLESREHKFALFFWTYWDKLKAYPVSSSQVFEATCKLLNGEMTAEKYLEMADDIDNNLSCDAMMQIEGAYRIYRMLAKFREAVRENNEDTHQGARLRIADQLEYILLNKNVDCDAIHVMLLLFKFSKDVPKSFYHSKESKFATKHFESLNDNDKKLSTDVEKQACNAVFHQIVVELEDPDVDLGILENVIDHINNVVATQHALRQAIADRADTTQFKKAADQAIEACEKLGQTLYQEPKYRQLGAVMLGFVGVVLLVGAAMLIASSLGVATPAILLLANALQGALVLQSVAATSAIAGAVSVGGARLHSKGLISKETHKDLAKHVRFFASVPKEHLKLAPESRPIEEEPKAETPVSKKGPSPS